MAGNKRMKRKESRLKYFGLAAYLFLGLVAAFAISGLQACSGSSASANGDDDHTEDGGTTTDDTTTKARHNFLIELSVGHVHIFRDASLTFSVKDTDICTDPADASTCTPMLGLTVTAFRRAAGATSTREQEMEAGVLVGNGDGTYTWTRSFNDLGANMVGIWFDEHGSRYYAAFPLETSRAGGEGFTCDTNGDGTPEFGYQVRWSASTGHIHANDEEVTFTLELMRTWNTPLNLEQPWTNSFDHLANLSLTVNLMADAGGSAIAALSPTYKGRGIYEVTHAFADADLGGQSPRTFWLDISFTDDQGCLVQGSTEEEEFHFPVVEVH